MSKNFNIVTFVDNDFQLEVRTDQVNETVWLTAEQMGLLFEIGRSAIVKHISNVLKLKELDNSTCSILEQVQFEGTRKVNRKIKIYNLDMIISVGYRVNSSRGIIFRRWANKVLKDYLIQGYAINEKRMIALNKTIEIQNKMLASSLNVNNDVLVSVIEEYTNALDLLDAYDCQRLVKPKGRQSIYKLTYADCRSIIDSMKYKCNSSIFGVEKEDEKLKGIISAIYQSAFGNDIYPSLEEKAAHLLYFLVKDHPFIDGCKRIAATLFLEYLNKNHALVKNGKVIIANDTLAIITLLIAESDPEEIDVIIKLVMNCIAK